jgi:hypothetical protein
MLTYTAQSCDAYTLQCITTPTHIHYCTVACFHLNRYVDSEELMSTIRAVNDALEAVEQDLWVLGRHELIIATPGAKNILTTDREFQVFIQNTYIYLDVYLHTVYTYTYL